MNISNFIAIASLALSLSGCGQKNQLEQGEIQKIVDPTTSLVVENKALLAKILAQ